MDGSSHMIYLTSISCKNFPLVHDILSPYTSIILSLFYTNPQRNRHRLKLTKCFAIGFMRTIAVTPDYTVINSIQPANDISARFNL